MEKKQITIEDPVAVSGITILPVTQTSIYGWRNKARISFFGLKKPLYVLILDSKSAVRAFTVTGEAVTLEEILIAHPEIREPVEKVVKKP